MFRTILPTALAFGAALGLAASAMAEPAVSPIIVTGSNHQVSRTVEASYDDLHTVAGAKQLAVRLKSAASTVCGGDIPITRQDADFMPCREGAIDNALSQVDSPMLNEAMGRPQTASR